MHIISNLHNTKLYTEEASAAESQRGTVLLCYPHSTYLMRHRLSSGHHMLSHAISHSQTTSSVDKGLRVDTFCNQIDIDSVTLW